MAAAKVINDLHYNGKTVNERLAAEGLLDQFTAAVEAKDATQMVGLLEQAAITKTWAARLATMILSGPPQPPIHLSLDDPRNAGVHQVRNDLKFPPCIRPVDPNDAYRLNQWQLNRNAKPLTPEQIEANRRAADEAKAKRAAEREASAIVPEGVMGNRAWHKGSPKKIKGRIVFDPSKTVQGKLVKIYPDTVLIQTGKTEDDTTEVRRRDLSKDDQALVAKIAARPKK